MRSFMSMRTLGYAEKGAGATDAKAEPAAAAETETETEKGADAEAGADADALDPITELQAEVIFCYEYKLITLLRILVPGVVRNWKATHSPKRLD
jgi:hypothetical protein